jgi:two-component system NtrC family sensor kinase
MTDAPQESVLVIEDDAALIALFRTVLRQAGFEYQSATSAAEAQKLLRTRHFDALVCDLSVVGGVRVFDLIKRVRAQHPEIAVLLVTGYTPEEISSQVAAQNVDLLEKPFSPPELVGRLKTLVNCRAA